MEMFDNGMKYRFDAMRRVVRTGSLSNAVRPIVLLYREVFVWPVPIQLRMGDMKISCELLESVETHMKANSMNRVLMQAGRQ